MIKRENFTNFKIISTKCDKHVLRNVIGITKWY